MKIERLSRRSATGRPRSLRAPRRDAILRPRGDRTLGPRPAAEDAQRLRETIGVPLIISNPLLLPPGRAIDDRRLARRPRPTCWPGGRRRRHLYGASLGGVLARNALAEPEAVAPGDDFGGLLDVAQRTASATMRASPSTTTRRRRAARHHPQPTDPRRRGERWKYATYVDPTGRAAPDTSCTRSTPIRRSADARRQGQPPRPDCPRRAASPRLRQALTTACHDTRMNTLAPLPSRPG